MESGWCERVQMHGGREHPPPPQAASALELPHCLLSASLGISFSPKEEYFFL